MPQKSTAKNIEYLAEGITLYLGDCREILPTLGKVDAVVTDPPYGMEFQSNYRKIKYDTARKRISDALKQPDFFVEQPAPIQPIQTSWDEMWSRKFDYSKHPAAK